MAGEQSVVTAFKPTSATHPVDQVLPLERLAVYGLQHVLAFYAGAVIVPLLLAAAIGLTNEQLVQLISADLFTCGGNPAAPDFASPKNLAFAAGTLLLILCIYRFFRGFLSTIAVLLRLVIGTACRYSVWTG
jgi:xanthine/uracil permease